MGSYFRQAWSLDRVCTYHFYKQIFEVFDCLFRLFLKRRRHSMKSPELFVVFLYNEYIEIVCTCGSNKWQLSKEHCEKGDSKGENVSFDCIIVPMLFCSYLPDLRSDVLPTTSDLFEPLFLPIFSKKRGETKIR